MKSGREHFKCFLDQAPLSRPVFIPFVRGLLSRVEDMPLETLTNDPALWANSLVKTTRLFGFDGVVAGFDPCLAARACGGSALWENDGISVLPPQGSLDEAPELSPSVQLSVEVAKRVFNVCRQDLSCLSALTGPYTLADQLFGSKEGLLRINEIKPLIVEITRAFCETKPDVLIFIEGKPLSLANLDGSHRRTYNTIKNIASYYNIPVGLYLNDYLPDTVTGFSKLNMDLYILGSPINKDLPLPSDVWRLGNDSLGLGFGLPLNDLDKAKKIIHEGFSAYQESKDHGVFFTSLAPASRDSDLEMLHGLMNEISNLDLNFKGDIL